MKKYAAAVIGAGICWGSTGFFLRNMMTLGFDTYGLAIIRFCVTGLLFGIYLVASDWRLLKIKPKQALIVAAAGFFGLLFTSVCYYKAIELTSLHLAAILMHTAPTMVMLISIPLFKEKLTLKKVLALGLAFVGASLVSGLGSGMKASAVGVLWGLGAGLGYAMYSILASAALKQGCDNRTVNFYSSLAGALFGIVLLSGQGRPLLMFASTGNFIWCLAMGAVSCFMPYLLYTYGLKRIQAGTAAVMTSLEPVTATLIGVFIFRESIDLLSVLGISLVLSAIVVINTGIRLRKKSVPALD